MVRKIILIITSLWIIAACKSIQEGLSVTPEPAFVPTPIFDETKFGNADLNIIYCSPDDLDQKNIYYPQSGIT